jgi:hypothetical protein
MRDPELGKEMMTTAFDPNVPTNLQSKIRRQLTKMDPLLFALLYLYEHISDNEDRVILSGFHLDVYSWAVEVLPNADSMAIKDKRTAFIAPRGAGKSTTLFVILPIWAMAHRHRTLIATYGASSEPIEDHLRNVRRELTENPLLTKDHSGLAEFSTNKDSFYYSKRTKVGMSAKGLDRSIRGKLEQGLRPDWILFDDVEPGESNYSDKEIEKRKTTILNDIIGGDANAVVSFVGTVTRAGSIMHDILRSKTENEIVPWVKEQFIQCRYYPALITNEDGSKVSMWANNPKEEWSTEFMCSIEKTNAFQVEKMNNPMGKQGKYWSLDDIRITPEAKKDLAGTRYILMVDPSITTKDTSDWTGLAVVAYTPAMAGSNPQVEVVDARHVKLVNEDLRMYVLRMLAEFPQIRYVRVEVNQGGDLWGLAHKPNDTRSRSGVFHDLPNGVGLMVGTTSLNKEIKFAQAHDFYQKPGIDIYHREHFGELERELIEFPKARWDDIADAVVMGINYFLKPAASKKIRTGSTEVSYL